MRRLSRFFVGVAAGLMTLAPATALAVPPVDLDSTFADYANVVDNVSDVEAAINTVPGKDLWVVVVDDFDGMTAQAWTMETYDKSGLEVYDGILVISVGTSEVFGYSDATSGLTEDLMSEALTQVVLDEFTAEEWDDGIIAYAENVASLMRGGTVSAGKAPNVVPLLIGILAVGGGIIGIAYIRKRKRQEGASVAQKDLAERASSELLAADDAVRAGAAELEFARAEFGFEATQEFQKTLEAAQANVSQAFQLRNLLGDDIPETPAQQQQMNTQILELSSSARAAMKAQEEGFTQLRQLASRVEEKISELETRRAEIIAALPLAKDKIAHLSHTFPAASLATLHTYPAQVETLLTSVGESLAQAHAEIAQQDRNGAVQYARLSESALQQAGQLMTRIDDAPQLLAQARERMQAGVASLSSDIEDARRLGGGDATIAARQREAEAIIARATTGTDVDLLTINDQLTEAEANLDLALTGVRQSDEVRRREQANLDRYRTLVQRDMENIDQDVTRYREAVSASTRTLVAHAQQAVYTAQNAPADQQLNHYMQAKELIDRARRALNDDLVDYQRYGGRYQRGYSSNSPASLGGEIAGAIIGGITRSIIYGGGSSSSWGSSGSRGSSGGRSSGRSTSFGGGRSGGSRSSGGRSSSRGGGSKGGFRKGF
ncbi:MAG: hypothetical protein GX483_03080 [Actinomycetaceae bacterium]|nr:hypothetical protein [Actinomycetaceae bacterium]